MMKLFLPFLLCYFIACNSGKSPVENTPANSHTTDHAAVAPDTTASLATAPIVVGAARTDLYVPTLQHKRVGVVVNQTSRIGDRHLVDSLLALGINIETIFAPEHGFRGTADAGESVEDGRDRTTGLPIVSLYGKNKKPTPAHVANLEVLLFDIQDVGARFYTYISTMHYVMETCAEQGIACMVLDRPNPNGHYVDGPVLMPDFQSFVGMHPVPVVHGMTIGEYAHMINGEGWLSGGASCELTVVPMQHYYKGRYYELPIAPSPNLPNMRSILLYPSLCFFEGTTVNVGRGTHQQFQVIGAPNWKGDTLADNATSYTPTPLAGATHPKHKHIVCYGYDLSESLVETLRQQMQLNLDYLLTFYHQYPHKDDFFLKNNFFDLLAGTDVLRAQVIAGATEAEIRASWEPRLTAFKEMRKRYLLYPQAKE